MRLIDADNVLSEMIEAVLNGYPIMDTFYSIAHQPTVDAVTVVRCKYCMHNIDGFCAKGLTPIGGFSTQEKSDNWFCSCGERKEITCKECVHYGTDYEGKLMCYNPYKRFNRYDVRDENSCEFGEMKQND